MQIVPVKPVAFCMAWHARGFEREVVHGGDCCFCGCAVAVPESLKGKPVACIYCGLNSGDVPEQEIEPNF